MKKAAIFFYALINGTWAFIAYLFHKFEVPLRAIAFALSIGVVVGNLAAYAGRQARSQSSEATGWAF